MRGKVNLQRKNWKALERQNKGVGVEARQASDTLVVTLTAVSDWLRLSVRPAHCLGPVARRCFSEVMSFWDLESSKRQTQG